MDTTHAQDLISQLEAADPATAPDIADDVTAALAGALEGGPMEARPELDPGSDLEPGEAP